MLGICSHTGRTLSLRVRSSILLAAANKLFKNMVNRGSEWRRWDLHIHTKGTNKNDCYSCADMDSYCKQLFKKAIEKEIYAIGITDYFSIARYKEVKEYQDNIDTNTEFSDSEKLFINGILLLPNVELRMLPVTDRGKLVNIHCIFNPDYVRNLDNDFFGSLSFKVAGQDFKMNESGLIGLGKHYDSSLDDRAAYKKGVEHFVTSHDRLQELFENNMKLRENTLIVVSNSNNDGNSAYQKHYDLFENETGSLDEVRRAIYTLSDCIFSSNEKDAVYFLGKSKDSKEVIKKRIRSLKPCIHGSDAHTESKMFAPDENRFCWIKADLTFNGLKQIVYEPEERVKIQELKPEDKKAYHLIDSITLNEPGFWEATIPLNHNLNTIIGGRSTGKSTLMAAIAKKIAPSVTLDNYRQNEFVNDHVNSLDIKWADDTVSAVRDIEYYGQGYLYNMAKSTEETNKLIGNIVLGSEHGEKLVAYNNICEDIKKQLSHDLLDLFQCKSLLDEKEKKSRETGNKDGIIIELKRLDEQVAAATKSLGMDEDELKHFHDMEAEIANKKKLIESCNSDMHLLKQMEIASPFKNNYTEERRFENLSEINENKVKLFDEYKQLVSKAEADWVSIVKKYLTFTLQIKERLSSEIQTIENNETYKKGVAYIQQNKVLTELKKRQYTEQKTLYLIEEIEKEIIALREKQSVLKMNIVNTHLKYSSHIDRIVSDLNIDFGGVKINVEKSIKKGDIYAFVEARFNRRGGERQSYIEHLTDDYASQTRQVCEEFLDKALRNQIDLKSSYEIENVTKEFFITNWFAIGYKVTYQNDSFASMSEGKKAFVILKLLLDFSKKECPILLDQPEDSLDNRAIYNELVEYIKTKKKTRQIIIVTHNPNLVVGADAENVIVANQNGVNSKNRDKLKFQYINGSLENSRTKNEECQTVLESQGIREHVCDILEGGDDAFRKREAKYGFTLI